MKELKDYVKEYEKVRNIYFKMKGGSKVFVLPCEINREAVELYLNRSIVENRDIKGMFTNYTDKSPLILNTDNSAEFCQDPCIFLKKISGVAGAEPGKIIASDFALTIYNGLDIEGMEQFDIEENIGNNYGGNFISSPDIDGFPGCIFCFSGLGPKLESFLNNNAIQTLVKLNCSFTYNGERHIDECMCFMPYGDSFKVWIYEFREITLEEKLREKIEKAFSDEEKTRLQEKLVKLRGSKFISNDIVTALKIILEGKDEEKDYLLNTKEGRVKYNKLKKRLILDEINCLESIMYGDKKTEELKHRINTLVAKLREERMINLDIISTSIFGKPYAEVSSLFVNFPLDIEVNMDHTTEAFNCKIMNIPIFNRIWIERPSKAICFLSSNGTTDPHIQHILNQEAPYIKSMIKKDKTINIVMIDTSKYNDEGEVGGNLHCLIKSKF